MSDKTGTITENRMQVEKSVLMDGAEQQPSELDPEPREKIARAVPYYSNDPTDKALQDAFGKDTTIGNQQPIGFEGFSMHPWRDLTYKIGDSVIHAISGKPELLIDASKMSAHEKELSHARLIEAAKMGKRVIACAQYGGPEKESLSDLEFLALIILNDPVRAGVKEAVKTLQLAGVRTILVTGDHPATTLTVAQEVGITGPVITGAELEKMSDEQLSDVLNEKSIFARTSPHDKLRIVQILQKKRETVAAMGDGNNDAPALKAAHVGIAMGEIGTDLAKEAADLILTDDNYVHLPDAVFIGRKALDNFKKGLTYYLSAKAILLSIFIVPLIVGVPFPFAPIQIILIELLMDLASSTIFVTESAEPDILSRQPQRITQFLGWKEGLEIVKNGIGLAAGITALYLFLYFSTHDLVLAQTAAFVAWLLGHILLALNLKQRKLSLFKQGLFSNLFGACWLVGMIALSLLITNVKFLYPWLQTTFCPYQYGFGYC